jgi:hypothetical protein
VKTRIRHLTILFAGAVIALSMFWGCSKQSTGSQTYDSSGRPTISPGERALAVTQVQNAFSRHAYYHAAGKHLDELADVWVKEDGPYAATVTWKNESGIIEGMDKLKKFYGESLRENQMQLLEQISKIVPEVKNVPENLGVGYEYSMHFQTTPVIEIAGDGKTAKGIWYSPGVHIGGSVLENGKTTMSGGWWMEKYGVDFVNEDGKWKIWHIGMYYDHTPPGWTYDENGQATYAGSEQGRRGGAPKAMVTTKTDTQHEAAAPSVLAGAPGGAPGGGSGGGGAPGGGSGGAPGGAPGGGSRGVTLKQNPDPYQAWSPLRATRIQPKFPEPYYTFSETFSY